MAEMGSSKDRTALGERGGQHTIRKRAIYRRYKRGTCTSDEYIWVGKERLNEMMRDMWSSSLTKMLTETTALNNLSGLSVYNDIAAYQPARLTATIEHE